MRRTAALGAGVLLLILASCQDTSQPLTPETGRGTQAAEPAFSLQSPAGDRVMPGQVLARFVDGADPAAVGRGHGLTLEKMGYKNRFAVLKGAVGNERALAARLKGDARVISAEPNWLRQPHEIDPRLWAFHNPGGLSISITRGRDKGVLTNYLSFQDADIDNMDDSYGVGGGPVAIASIDTGVDFDHVEFGQANLQAGWDYYSGDADPSDSEGHGTHTTGTMVGDNVGVAGVSGAASNITVYVYRVCGPLGCPTDAIVNAIYAAADAGVVAMNLSLGGGSLSSEESAAIAYATGENALVIASAGNDGTGTVNCPACDPNAISVAASNWQDQLSYYSNWGPGLDITAPGGELYSNTTDEAGIWSSVPGGYAYYQGTSMAAPQVTGAAAVVASMTGATGSALRSALLSTADDLGDSYLYGAGRLDVYEAVTGAEYGGGDPPPPPPPPPPAELTAAFTKSCSGASCTFDGSGSTGAISWAWLFGDGDSGNGTVVSHIYGGAGTYTVELTVSDGTDPASTTQAVQTVSCRVAGKNLKCR